MKKVMEELENVGLLNGINNNLKEAYYEALKNPAFKELIDKLKVKEAILIKYTSMLEDSSKEYSNCLNVKIF